MALINSFKFTETLIHWDVFAKATHNQYQVVSVRDYKDKKGILPDGYTLTLMVLKDDFDYGVDKDGKKLEDNTFQNFDATVLSRKTPIRKGDIVRLIDFNSDNSYAIKYDLLLRFNDYEVLKTSKVNDND